MVGCQFARVSCSASMVEDRSAAYDWYVSNGPESIEVIRGSLVELSADLV